MTDTQRGLVYGGAVIGGLVALDIALGISVALSGTYMLAVFVAAVVGDMLAATSIGLITLAAALGSGAWNDNFGSGGYWARAALTVAAVGFSVAAARTRATSMTALRRQRMLSAVADLPEAGTTAAQTALRVTQLLVPQLAHFAAIDIRRGDTVERLAAGGRADLEAEEGKLITPLRARGGPIGDLVLVQRSGTPYTPDESEFVRVLSGRVALALDNAGLSSELSTVEQQLVAILGSLAEAVTVQDSSGALVFANRAAAELLGVDSVETLLATPPGELLTRFESFNEDGSALRADQLPGRRVLQGEDAPPLVVRVVDRDTGEELWRVTKATPVRGADGEVALAVNIIEDITEARRADAGNRLLSEATALLSTSLDYSATLQRVADLAVAELADCCSVSIPRGEGLARVAFAPRDSNGADWDAPAGAAEVLQTGRSQLTGEAMLVPLSTPERTIGVMSLRSANRRFTAADVTLAEELARRAAIALENARLHTELTEIAFTLQRSLMPPELPQVPGWSFRSLYLPAAGEADVGGDFYDVFPTGAGWMAVIGDVVGRGAAAASLTAMARYTLRTAGSLVGTPTMGLARLNDNLRERGEMALCTAAVVLLRGEDEDGESSVVCAGHPLPVLVRGGEPKIVGRTGPLLGAFEKGHWLPAQLAFESGDVLVLFTDGVTDARGPNGHGRFGEERLLETLVGTHGADDVVRRIQSALERFSGGEHTDDTAVLALERN